MANINAQFGQKVRKSRKSKGWSQERFAEQIKRDPRTVVAIEAGKRNPTLKTIQKIALAFGMKIKDLFE